MKQTINQLDRRLQQGFKTYLSDLMYRTSLFGKSLVSPSDKIQKIQEKIKELSNNLKNQYIARYNSYQYKYQSLSDILEAKNPLSVMKRGFALTMKDKKVVTSIKDININDQVDIVYEDGSVITKVLEKRDKHE